jgi:hypothetical protein
VKAFEPSSLGAWAKMNVDTAIDLEKAKLDPGSVFSSPADVLEAHGLSVEDRKVILLRWEDDAEALLRATEEGMPPVETRAPAEILRSVQAALSRIEEQGRSR